MVGLYFKFILWRIPSKVFSNKKKEEKIMSEKEEKKLVIIEELYNLCMKYATFFKDSTNTVYCRPNGKNILFSIDSELFQVWITKLARKQQGLYIKTDSVKNLRPQLKDDEGLTKLAYTITKRCAMHEGYVYIDLADDENNIVCINDDGVNITKKIKHAIFKRSESMRPLPLPDMDVKPSSIIKLLHKILILSNEQAILLAVWLVMAFLNEKQSPMLMLCGSKGSAKTWTMNCITNLIDPSSNSTPMMPNNERDLAVLLDNTYTLGFDNISQTDIKGRISDMLCISVTRGTYSLRTLYTDRGVTSLKLNNRIILNGISQSLLSKSDALDRTVVFDLQRLPVERMIPMSELKQTFEDVRPKILGAIFNTIKEVLSTIDDVDIKNISRMGEFCKYGYCICELIGVGGETFMDVYANNLHLVNEKMLESDMVANAILEIMEDKDILQESVSELHARVIDAVRLMNGNVRDLPQSANHFSTKLLELKSNLEQCGLYISKKNTGAKKVVTIERMKKS